MSVLEMSIKIHMIIRMSLVMRKPAFCICENKDAVQLRGNREADPVFVFTTQIVQSLYYLNPKFQASSHLLWLYGPVCVRPGRKPRRQVFSERGSYIFWSLSILGLVLFYRPCFQHTLHRVHKMSVNCCLVLVSV